jgi:cytochrome P450 family 135
MRRMSGKVTLPGSPFPAPVQAALFVADPVRFLKGSRRRYGPNFRLKMPVIGDVAYLSDPAAIKQVFTGGTEDFHAGEGNVMLRPLLGRHSLLLLDEEEHLAHRRMLLPPFHGDAVRRYADTVRALTAAEVETWRDGESFPTQPRMQRVTLGVIMRAVVGVRDDDRAAELAPLLQRLLGDVTAWDMVIFSAWPNAADSRIGRRLPQLRALARVDELLYDEIARHRAEPGEDVLSLLIAARDEDGRGMSDEELRDELVTLLVAGHETTASELAWAFERLSRSPPVLARLREEIDAADGDAYLTATIQETLRRRPVLPNAAPRLVKREIEIGGWTYPPGACLVAHTYLIHHDPEIYPDPYAFRPERFLDEAPGTYTWTPFGGGRRRCLGASFATLEMKIVLRAVLATAGLGAAGNGAEPSRRRSITLSPGEGAATILS